MKTIILPASVSSNLDWSHQLHEIQGPVLVELDFGWNQGPFFVNNPATFQSFTLALDQFSKDVWPLIKDHSPGVVLYRGSLAVLSMLVVAEGNLTPVEAATVFGSYLHRLASFLPDEAIPYCLFEEHAHFTLGEAAHLLSQERFLHLQLSLVPSKVSTAILLPPDELCSTEIIQKLTGLLEGRPDLRVIPERWLNELWNELDELIVFDEALTVHGKRQLLGFQAAGGKIRSRGI
ncbi:MAG: hypothetical protein ACRDF4_06505 [Rhabdochlamydiaceae bacterium]